MGPLKDILKLTATYFSKEKRNACTVSALTEWKLTVSALYTEWKLTGVFSFTRKLWQR